MKRTTISVLYCLIALTALSINNPAQCDEIFTKAETDTGYRKQTIPAKIKKDEMERRNGLEREEFTHVFVFLRDERRFKIKLDGDHVGDFAKTNDLIPFTVVDNVYGYAKFPSQVFDPSIAKDGGWRTEVTEKRCVLIPKDSKVFGTVDHANSRYPLAIGGKGKLIVTVNKVLLPDGSEIPIKFVEPADQVAGTPPEKKVIYPCRHYTNRPCIRGRRGKYGFPADVISSSTDQGIIIAQNEGGKITDGVAIFSVVSTILKAGNIEQYINPPNAVLKMGMVFEVETEDVIDEQRKTRVKPGAWWPLAKPAEKKEEEKKEGEDKDK